MVIIQHKDITHNQILAIADVKSKVWDKYTFGEHITWINENIKTNDYHVFLKNMEAYLNIINCKAEIDGRVNDLYGFGNLCAAHNGWAYGSMLMRKALLHFEGKFLSFCNIEYVNYYKHFDWQFAHKSKLDFPNIDLDQIYVMTYGFEFETLKYTGGKF